MPPPAVFLWRPAISPEPETSFEESSAQGLPAETAWSEDRLLDGRIFLKQPRDGYRAAIDPVLLAAATPAAPGERILDVGAGVGAPPPGPGRRGRPRANAPARSAPESEPGRSASPPACRAPGFPAGSPPRPGGGWPRQIPTTSPGKPPGASCRATFCRRPTACPPPD